jgi:hypothetical protein
MGRFPDAIETRSKTPFKSKSIRMGMLTTLSQSPELSKELVTTAPSAMTML